MKKCLLWLTFISCKLFAQETKVVYLSGTDKDHTVQWDFYCTTGMNSGKWSKIAVPSNWELQGFGTYNYYRDEKNPGEKGLYKYSFRSPAGLKQQKIQLVFEGVMTDAEVKVNGRVAGPVHQGGFYQFRYDITGLLKEKGENLLEVAVSKHSADESVNRAERKADFWLFGGIYRPVYLQVLPLTYIDHIAIDARAGGEFGVQVFTKNTKPGQSVQVQLQGLDGETVGAPFSEVAADSVLLKTTATNVRKWNPEQPHLYQAVIAIKEGDKVMHRITQRFGFRTVDFRPGDGFYLNNVKLVFKGVNRHSEWPESGRTLSREIHLMDIGLIKDMNMNAVRMSHYPPDQEFLDLCDSLGLLVIDELTGWQDAYNTTVGRKLVREMVQRDVNHPAIITWSNGNEGGWNRELDGDYALYDPQRRLVIHPWEKFNGTDTKHYPDFNYITNSVLYGNEVFFPTEFMHGLFDGGHGAALEDFWQEMSRHPHFGGGFLWSLHDEGVVRTDSNGIIDVVGTSAPDGIVGPHREKEASFYTIKQLWSPVVVHTKVIPVQFDGKLQVENKYLYTNLDQVQFEWKTVSFPTAASASVAATIRNSGKVQGPSLLPGAAGWLTLPFTADTAATVLYLTAYDAAHHEITTWSWPLQQPAAIAGKAIQVAATAAAGAQEDSTTLTVGVDGIQYYFNKTNGYLQKVVNGKKQVSLSGGPALAGAEQPLSTFKQYKQGNQQIIEVTYAGNNRLWTKWSFESGRLPQLSYQYIIKGAVDFMGITFNYPEEKITGMKWLGRGPYRVWKNRLKGMQLGVWEKKYNNTVTGESWDYPEFKGWHANLYWVTVQTKEADFTVYTGQENMFLEMLQPQHAKAARNNNTQPPFPTGNIGFMHAISAIGTKFQPAEVMGPQSAKNMQLNYSPLEGTLWFDFR